MREAKLTSLLFYFTEVKAESVWTPLTDIYQTREGWLIKIELAGVRPQDVSISAQGGQFCISGTRRDCTLEEGCSHYLLEIPYIRFERKIELPSEVEAEAIKTEFQNGMLLLYVKRKQ